MVSAPSLPVCAQQTRLPPLLPASPSVKGRLCWPPTPLLSTWPPNTSYHLGTVLKTSGSHSSASGGQCHAVFCPRSDTFPRLLPLSAGPSSPPAFNTLSPSWPLMLCLQRNFTPGPIFWILLDYSPLLPELHSRLKPQFPEQESGGALRPRPPPAHVAALCESATLQFQEWCLSF